MDTKDNGGPAFPISSDHYSTLGEIGMTLRDYFAVRAMQAMIPDMYDYEETRETHAARSRLMASDVYAVVDAILEARKQ